MLQNLLLGVLLVFTSTSPYRQTNTYQSTPQRGVYGTYTPTQPTQSIYRGFGYGSQRAYQSPITFQVDGTYTYQPGLEYDAYNYGGGSAVHGGGPRRAKGYDGDEEINTGNGHKGNPDDLWNPDYDYYYNNGYWYRCHKTTGKWEIWDSIAGLGILGWGWQNVGGWHGSVPDNPRQLTENPTPIGSPLTMAVPAAIYAIIEYRRRRRSEDEFA